MVTVSKGQVMDSGRSTGWRNQLAKRLESACAYVDLGFTRAHLELRAELFEAIGIRKR